VQLPRYVLLQHQNRSLRRIVDGMRARVVPRLFMLLTACAFGPYVVGSVRTEQISVYAMVLVAFVLGPALYLRAHPPAPTISLILTWGTYALIATIGALFPLTQNRFPWPSDSVIAGVDNLALPLAILALVIILVREENRESVIRSVCLTTVVCSVTNALIAIVMTGVDLSGFLRHWWSAVGDTQMTVADFAAALGRVSGVFNQPAEAGVMYGLAGVAAVYLWSNESRFLYPAVVLISIGGILCVSKEFILVGAPIILWQTLRARRGRVGGLIGIGVFALVAFQSGPLSQWTGLSYLGQLVSPGQGGILSFYTAGRLGSSSSLIGVVDQVIRVSPLTGAGAGGLQVPYDNGWVEALVFAGLLGVLAYTASLCHFVVIAGRLAGKEARLAWGIAGIAIFGSVGIPVLTANRAGSVLWILMGTLSISAVGIHRDAAFAALRS
jgi:hypothetical protein